MITSRMIKIRFNKNYGIMAHCLGDLPISKEEPPQAAKYYPGCRTALANMLKDDLTVRISRNLEDMRILLLPQALNLEFRGNDTYSDVPPKMIQLAATI